MITRGIREFVARDWEAVRENKDDYWAERIARLGPAEALRIGDELRRQAQRLNPQWPTAEERAEDFREHVRLSEIFRRVAAAGVGTSPTPKS